MRSLLALLALTSGCSFYFGNDDDDCDPPMYGAGAPEAVPQYRDPWTGVCQDLGWRDCDSRCGPCDDVADQAFPDWASCYGPCEGLAEGDCLATTACRAIYDVSGFTPAFFGCWGVAPSGPVEGGNCLALDAYECSRHDDCAAFYYFPAYATLGSAGDVASTPFQYCAPEASPSCANVDCGPGSHCEQQCREELCGTDAPCPMTCSAVCVPDVSSCSTIDCDSGYECVEVCTGAGGTIPPTCQAQCVPVTACEALTTEMECIARGDCRPVYDGQECTCYPNGCTCEILTYERCESPVNAQGLGLAGGPRGALGI
ncbi:MAG: hypothetical protein AB7P03_13930 [Kofleriaceae bacterium]